MQRSPDSRLRILIVEDEPNFARALKSLLLSEGRGLPWDIEIARTAREAVNSANRHPPALVLMDIRLPDEDGIQCTRRIKEMTPSATVIMLTVSDDEDDLFASLEAGASGYLLKSMDLHDLVSTTRAIVEGHLVIPTEMAGPILEALGRTAGASSRQTSGEEEILRLISEGWSDEEVGKRLGLSIDQVERRIGRIYERLHSRLRRKPPPG